ncbi:hypothetical protein CEY12_13940 [Chryseobacterium sp. T16E-39]|uniref:hypothetical protein n=1 Tax=Chryseobacterium sp. T16E-39 TaxID=2015076 RepID=UPI000B5B3B48|nr:hypothetical protein [Chryseobacterium sp. T16E-39]ASK31140.1 hypothetical protein CEY12_13940 [Chryseobacterium sp. T16E-39]
MKKLIFTSLLGLGLLLPANFSASTNSTTSKTEFSSKKPKKSKTRKSRKSRSGKTSSKIYSKSRGCTYNGYPLNVGPRGGCYYYSGSSKEYVDRSYCSGCN